MVEVMDRSFLYTVYDVGAEGHGPPRVCPPGFEPVAMPTYKFVLVSISADIDSITCS